MNILLNLKKIYYRIKYYLFKKELMTYDFPNIDVADIEKAINLKQRAETDGRNNIPPQNAIVRSITEEEAITVYDNNRHKAVDKAVKTKKGVETKVKTVGKMKDGTVVSEFYFTWSFKVRNWKK